MTETNGATPPENQPAAEDQPAPPPKLTPEDRVLLQQFSQACIANMFGCMSQMTPGQQHQILFAAARMTGRLAGLFWPADGQKMAADISRQLVDKAADVVLMTEEQAEEARVSIALVHEEIAKQSQPRIMIPPPRNHGPRGRRN